MAKKGMTASQTEAQESDGTARGQVSSPILTNVGRSPQEVRHMMLSRSCRRSRRGMEPIDHTINIMSPPSKQLKAIVPYGSLGQDFGCFP